MDAERAESIRGQLGLLISLIEQDTPGLRRTGRRQDDDVVSVEALKSVNRINLTFFEMVTDLASLLVEEGGETAALGQEVLDGLRRVMRPESL